MKKLKIIYRSGAQTTVEYDEKKVDLFNAIIMKDHGSCISIVDEGTRRGKVFIRVDQIDHMEVL